jgi:phosphoglycerate dehydrogenase-like enzyme
MRVKTLIADKFSEGHIARLNQLGCEVTYKPTAKAEELPGLIGMSKILVVRGKQVTAETLQAASEVAAHRASLRPGRRAGVRHGPGPALRHQH